LSDPRTKEYNKVATALKDTGGVKPGGMKRNRFERVSQEEALAKAAAAAAAAAVASSSSGGGGGGSMDEGEGSSSSSTTQPPKGPPKTLLEMFEAKAHWKKAEIVAGLRAQGWGEDRIEAEIKDKSDYVRSGKFNAHYICKVVYTVPSMPPVDPSAAAARIHQQVGE
jgi:hypothetical protein